MSAPGQRCVVLGGGGHAKVVLDSLQAARAVTPVAVLDRDAALWGTSLLDVPILGGDELLPDLKAQGVTYFAVGLGMLGSPEPRTRLFLMGRDAGLTPLTVIHPRAVCSPHATLGPGCQLFAGCIVNAGAVLGANVIINTGAIIEHDCRIGDHAHVATGARLAGRVCVGAGAHVGAGATILEGRSIGEQAIVGAGAVVVRDVMSRTVVAGVPARPLRPAGGSREAE